MKNRWILHLDINNFYAGTHLAMNPGLRGKAVVVLSNNDGNIIARSPLAKAMGIPMGQPFHEIKRLVEQGKVTAFSSLYPLYGDLSTRVMNILRRFLPVIEPYSIDEVFGQVEGTVQAVTALARQIQETIRLWLRLPVSIGIAATKSLAKVATYVAKRQPEHQGVFAFSDPQAVHTVLKTLPVWELWGIGRQSAKKLAAIGVTTAFEFTQLPDGWIQKQLTIQGLRLAHELRGEVRKPLQVEMKPKKSIVVAPSFGRPVRDWETVCKALKRQ